MTPAENAYQEWLNKAPESRYGSLHRDTFTAGYKAGVRAAAEEVKGLSDWKHIEQTILSLLEKP